MNVDWPALFEAAAKLGLLGVVVVAFCLLAQIVYYQVTLRPVMSKDAPKVVIGTLAIGAVVFIITICAWLASLFAPEPTRNVDVVLTNQGQTLRRDFSLSYSSPDRGQVPLPGKLGLAEIRGLPRQQKTLRIIDIECRDFAPQGTLPKDFVIPENQQVQIEMMEDIPADPTPIDQYPNPTERVPAKENVFQSPKVDPKNVIFKYKNSTGKDGRLALYSCAAHYEPWVDGSAIRPRWLDLAFPSSAEEKIYESFDSGCGWFVFYFQRAGSQIWEFIATKCLFDSANSRLIVTLENEKAVGTFD